MTPGDSTPEQDAPAPRAARPVVRDQGDAERPASVVHTIILTICGLAMMMGLTICFVIVHEARSGTALSPETWNKLQTIATGLFSSVTTILVSTRAQSKGATKQQVKEK